MVASLLLPHTQDQVYICLFLQLLSDNPLMIRYLQDNMSRNQEEGKLWIPERYEPVAVLE